ncbi:hypothetical protein J4453_02725 [Candidatus Woesearchaeota archaeon]|nr:hypothetical protein [Candidatus Woesearchaeota archaeon]
MLDDVVPRLKSYLLIGITAGLTGLSSSGVNAQTPFYTARAPPKTYAIEGRISQKINEEPNIAALFKTFRKEIPVWGYLKQSYQKRLGSTVWGIGPIVNIRDHFYMLPTLEGTPNQLEGVTFYSTLFLGKGFHVDFHPKLDHGGKYQSMPFNIGKKYEELIIGMSSDMENLREDVRDVDFRVDKANKGNVISVRVNFKEQRIGFAYQRAFNIH